MTFQLNHPCTQNGTTKHARAHGGGGGGGGTI